MLPDRECFVEFLLERENLVVFRARRDVLAVEVVPGVSREIGDLLASVQFHFDSRFSVFLNSLQLFTKYPAPIKRARFHQRSDFVVKQMAGIGI